LRTGGRTGRGVLRMARRAGLRPAGGVRGGPRHHRPHARRAAVPRRGRHAQGAEGGWGVKAVRERIMARVTRTPEGCWVYGGSLSPNGYATTTLGRASEGRGYVRGYVHRIMYSE